MLKWPQIPTISSKDMTPRSQPSQVPWKGGGSLNWFCISFSEVFCKILHMIVNRPHTACIPLASFSSVYLYLLLFILSNSIGTRVDAKHLNPLYSQPTRDPHHYFTEIGQAKTGGLVSSIFNWILISKYLHGICIRSQKTSSTGAELQEIPILSQL